MKALNISLKSMIIGLIAMAMIGSTPLSAQSKGKNWPKLHTNQQQIEEALGKSDLQIDNYLSVLEFVLNSLPDKAKVYPAENYYYFSFHFNGIKYAGNLRFDVSDRDAGVVHFAYFKAFTAWHFDQNNNYHKLGPKDGVVLKKTADLKYELSFRGRTVAFALNDLASVKPPEGVLLKGEEYIGPVYDEAGLGFYLIFNKRLKVFHYVLVETKPLGDILLPTKIGPRVVVGQRTGFAFYQDKYAPRKILIGVYAGNSSVNNYLDGPFDQLPDNFIQGDALLRAILTISPESKGHIDRLGNSPGGETRFLISPYMHYLKLEELQLFEECASAPEVGRDVYHACFTVAVGPEDEQTPPPLPEEGEAKTEPAPPTAAGKGTTQN